MLPPEIWNKILFHAFIGQGSPDTDTLDNCRKVCREWNVMIKRSVWKKPNKEWGIITKSMIKKNWSLVPGCLPSDKMISHAKELEMEGVLAFGVLDSLVERVKDKIDDDPSSLPVVICAASLAHHGYLGSVEEMRLSDVDLTSVPAEHLASLVSSVIGYVAIYNVSSCGLVTILDSVKSERLRIFKQSLDSEETRALVRAMESRVEDVRLGDKVTLDIGALLEYSGQGKCGEVECYSASDTAARYRDQLRAWAQATSRNWEVICDLYDYDFGIRRI